MAYVYRHFIPKNTAPAGAHRIGVYDSTGRKVCSIPLGGLTPPTKDKLYSFGLVSDIHIMPWNASIGTLMSSKFENALKWFSEQAASFVCVTGDMVQRGFVNSSGEYVTDEFEEYRRICNLFPNLPIYEICGNHESMYANITNHLEELETYTGNTLTYSITHNDDLFIFIGQPAQLQVMSDDALQWLSDTLETNTGRRCFVFIHSYIEEDSGDPGDHRENSIFETWGTSNKNAFMELMRQYDNAVLFHGHSHMKFQYQEYDTNANYTERNGFKSVHIPSLGLPRDIDFDTNQSKDDPSASQGYIVDVYDDCIVLNGWDFIGNKPVPLGTYKIET